MVDRTGAKLGCERRIGGQTRIKRGHQANVGGGEALNDAAQIIRRTVQIAVGDHQQVVPGELVHVDQVRDLAVAAVLGGVHHQGDVTLGEALPQPFDNGDGRIRLVLHAEHDLLVRVVLRTHAGQCRFQQRLVAIERLEQGQRRPRLGRQILFPGKATHRPPAHERLANPGHRQHGGTHRN